MIFKKKLLIVDLKQHKHNSEYTEMQEGKKRRH